MERPAPWAVGRVRVRVHSGPRDDLAPDGATIRRWRWRADVAAADHKRETIWTGWGTRDEAEQEILEERVKAGRGADVGVTATLRTLRDLVQSWVADVVAGDRSTYTTIARKGCADRLVDALGTTPLDGLIGPAGRVVLERWVRGSAYAPSTVAQDHRMLRAAWAWGVDHGYLVGTLPRMRLRRGEPVRNRRTPTPEESDKVLEALKVQSPWAWRVVYLLAWTGCRPGEIGSLTWDRVDLVENKGWATVIGKTGSRTIPLPGVVVAELEAWARPTAYVSGMRPSTVRGCLHKRLMAACDLAEVPRWPPYGLRRALVDRLYSAEDPSVAAAILGHSAATAIQTYRTVRGDETRAAMERLSESLSKPKRKRR